MDKRIEVVVTDGTSDYDKGKLLEDLVAETLSVLQYRVQTEVRITGEEVDVLAIHNVTGETVFVECKAHRSPIQSDVIKEAFGNYMLKKLSDNVSAVWLMTTSQLGKDAKGLLYEWDKQPPEEKRRVQVYQPEQLLRLLADSHKIVDAPVFSNQNAAMLAEEAVLVLSNLGRFWIRPVLDNTAGVAKGLFLFDAGTGNKISNEKIANDLSKTDFSLRDLRVILDDHTTAVEDDLAAQEQTVVCVPSSDSWADYRPARPKDFVGRYGVQDDMFHFLNQVRGNTTKTRLLAITSPSGWGKSSFLLKLMARCQNQRNRSRFFVFAVDCRAATSSRFGELALVSCLKAAVQAEFIQRPSAPLHLGTAVDPFSDSTVSSILRRLREERKVVVLFFDQFEEIFSKTELSDLFDSLTGLCNAVDGGQENLVLGFSWKTDGVIPQDNPAYHMWQGLSDRRKEFDIPAFNTREISGALTVFQHELGQTLNPRLRRMLVDQCQGYPWLLKKLCIHIYTQIQQGTDQRDMSGQALNVGELFQHDYQQLGASEASCLERIARDSPAPFFQIEGAFDSPTVQSLLDKRLIVRTGPNLTVYWDTFRDYVISKKTPAIPVSYIPQSDINRYVGVLRLLLDLHQCQLQEIAKQLHISEGGAENVVRDMVMIGNAEYTRRHKALSARQSEESAAIGPILDFWKAHRFYQFLVKSRESGETVRINQLVGHLKYLYPQDHFSDKTWHTYGSRIVRWLQALKLVEVDGEVIVASERPAPKTLTALGIALRGTRLLIENVMLGAAPPVKAMELLARLRTGSMTREAIVSGGYRNALYVLKQLGMVTTVLGTISLVDAQNTDRDSARVLAQRAKSSPTVSLMTELIAADISVSNAVLGSKLADLVGAEWSPTSQLRYGCALRNWSIWATATLGISYAGKVQLGGTYAG